MTALEKIESLIGELTEDETYQAAKMFYEQLPSERQADLINECIGDDDNEEAE